MKDFRSQVVKNAPTPIEIDGLLKEGQLAKALRKARVAGFGLPQQQIDATAEKLFRSGRAGELLALIGSIGLQLPFDTPTLLRRAFEVCDYHTFLKQALRLGARDGFEREIGQAIAAIEDRAPSEASAWRLKFGRSA